MATARETLYEEFSALSENPPGDDAPEIVRKLMARYRVQTKPGVDTVDGLTARDDLGNRLLDIWKAGGADVKDKIGTEIDKFRMQAKSKGSAKKAAPKKAASPRPATAAPAAAAAPAPEAPAPAPRERGSPRMEPVAGGPRRRGKTRSECPKCHSKGVVLARSYAGDEYYSCIYCGWQTFKPVDENDPTASLAGRLLGQSSGEQ